MSVLLQFTYEKDEYIGGAGDGDGDACTPHGAPHPLHQGHPGHAGLGAVHHQHQ